MANEINGKWGSSTAITITVDTLTTTSARQSAEVTGTSPVQPHVQIFCRLTTGTSPTANGNFAVYLAESDENGTVHRDGAVSGSDAAYTGALTQLMLLKSQIVDGTSDQAYYFSVKVYDVTPDFVIVVENNTSVTTNTTAGNHWVRYRRFGPEVQ